MNNNKVTLIERIETQASRLEVLRNAVGTVLSHNSTLYEKLEHEVRVSKSILAQAQDEATTKVETKAETVEPDVPAEVQAVIDGLMAALKEQGIDATIMPVPVHRGPLNIADILKKL